jgi:predicted GNAT family acetyltransferase
MNNKAKYLSSKDLQEQLPVFCQPWWLDIVCRDWDIALALDENGYGGVFPYQVERKYGLNIIRNPLLTPYLGPCFLYPAGMPAAQKITWEEKTFEQLWQQLPGYDSFDILAGPDFSNFLLFHHKGCSNHNKITYQLNLSPQKEVLFSGIQTNYRNLIRKAETVHDIVEGASYAEQLINMHAATFKRKNKAYPFSAGLMRSLISAAYSRHSGRVYAAKDDKGKVTAAIFTVQDKDKAYLLLSTMDPAHAHQGAVRLLIWHSILQAKAQGLNIYDFEGSMDPGIEPFFRRFGGERSVYLGFTHHRSLLWRLKKTLLG